MLPRPANRTPPRARRDKSVPHASPFCHVPPPPRHAQKGDFELVNPPTRAFEHAVAARELVELRRVRLESEFRGFALAGRPPPRSAGDGDGCVDPAWQRAEVAALLAELGEGSDQHVMRQGPLVHATSALG